MKTEREILDRLEQIELKEVGWEDGENILTFNGDPIGSTIRRNIEVNRWWPALKRELAKWFKS
jgi:hypothetical protein